MDTTDSHAHFIPLPDYHEYPPEEMLGRSRAFYESLRRRRTVRSFSARPVPREVIENCIRAAGTAPSGANMQPWYFVAVADAGLKRRIRTAAEAEEREFYERRAPREWLDALAPLGTDAHKPFLETAPYLIAIFAQRYGHHDSGEKIQHYYVQESVGIASGLLLAALHEAGLATLTHTPSPMRFLNPILDRPANEKPYLLVVTGYPADDAEVPNIHRKPVDEICRFL